MRRATGFAATTALVVASVASVVTTAIPAGARTPGRGSGHGGSLTFAITGETTGGFCLPQGQLASPGIQEALAIYDPLAIINSKGKYVPYLAKSITPNATYDEWTIGLRPGVKSGATGLTSRDLLP